VVLCIFGASGGIGRELVRQARDRGHTVRAVLRGDPPFDPAGVELIRGDAYQPEVAMRAVAGCDTVASALGSRRRGPMNPWSAVVSPPDFASQAARHVVAAMLAHGVRRVSAVSAAGVGDSAAGVNAPFRLVLAVSNIGGQYADLDRMEAVYRDSGLDWQCVRPVTLSDGPRTGKVAIVDRFALTASIARADVAGWMLDELARPAFTARTPQLAAG
jgi:uncharacterized protein YbjT (DUF2867 family)